MSSEGYSFDAATALHHGMAVMARNVRHFAPTGVEVVDHWPG